MTFRRREPFVWVTWLSKLMAGDTSCEWAPWFKSQFQDWPKVPSDFDLAEWNIAHTRMLRELRAERLQLGERPLIESQAQFRYRKPTSSLVVSGKPDLVTTTADDVVTVFDCKTGNPRASDTIQLRLYMYFLAETQPAFRGKDFMGIAVYKNDRVEVPGYVVDDRFVDNVQYFLDVLDSPTPPLKAPSFNECRFCDISRADCAERVDVAPPDFERSIG